MLPVLGDAARKRSHPHTSGKQSPTNTTHAPIASYTETGPTSYTLTYTTAYTEGYTEPFTEAYTETYTEGYTLAHTEAYTDVAAPTSEHVWSARLDPTLYLSSYSLRTVQYSTVRFRVQQGYHRHTVGDEQSAAAWSRAFELQVP